MKKHKIENRKKMIDMRADLEKTQIEIREETMKENPDMNKIRQLADKIGAIKADMIVARTEAVIYFRKVLTSEQRKKMDEKQLWRHHGKNS